MANRLAGITVTINGDTTGLSKALETVNKTIKDTQSQLNADGTVFEHVATAANGWHAVKVGSQIGWVSGKYSKITTA